jgi:hypothetical protein
MVALSTPRKPSHPVLKPRFWRLLGVFFLFSLGLIFNDRNQDTDVTYYFPEQHSLKNPSFLHCEDFSSDLRLQKNISIDAEVDKIYAAYLTQYHPPFWISQHSDDKEIVNKGQNLRQLEQTSLMERVLGESRKGDVVFYHPNDSGWFSLLAASKPRRRVRIYHPQNQTNVVRLCESILLNQWHLEQQSSSEQNSLHENGVAVPRVQIITDPMLAFPTLETQSQSSIALLKLQGDDILTVLQDGAVSSLLRSGVIEYLWIEYRSGKGGDDELEAILNSVSHSGDYPPYWPEASSDTWSSGRGTSCRLACHFWFKHKITKITKS